MTIPLDIKKQFEEFRDKSPLTMAKTFNQDQVETLMYGSYVAGYNLGLEEVTKELRKIV